MSVNQAPPILAEMAFVFLREYAKDRVGIHQLLYRAIFLIIRHWVFPQCVGTQAEIAILLSSIRLPTNIRGHGAGIIGFLGTEMKSRVEIPSFFDEIGLRAEMTRLGHEKPGT